MVSLSHGGGGSFLCLSFFVHVLSLNVVGIHLPFFFLFFTLTPSPSVDLSDLCFSFVYLVKIFVGVIEKFLSSKFEKKECWVYWEPATYSLQLLGIFIFLAFGFFFDPFLSGKQKLKKGVL